MSVMCGLFHGCNVTQLNLKSNTIITSLRCISTLLDGNTNSIRQLQTKTTRQDLRSFFDLLSFGDAVFYEPPRAVFEMVDSFLLLFSIKADIFIADNLSTL